MYLQVESYVSSLLASFTHYVETTIQHNQVGRELFGSIDVCRTLIPGRYEYIRPRGTSIGP
jgi:hypothetical protein